MPGATRTGFEDNSGSTQALVWRLPLYVMEADEVSRAVANRLMLLLEVVLKVRRGVLLMLVDVPFAVCDPRLKIHIHSLSTRALV